LNNDQAQSARKRIGRVLTDYQAAYSDPITMHSGEELQLSEKKDNWHGWIWLWCTNQAGKSGWVPECYIEQTGNAGKALYDYDAIELSVSMGEVLSIEKEESGWLWCSTQQGKSGWVPAEHIAINQ
jgi:SH3 domain